MHVSYNLQQISNKLSVIFDIVYLEVTDIFNVSVIKVTCMDPVTETPTN